MILKLRELRDRSDELKNIEEVIIDFEKKSSLFNKTILKKINNSRLNELVFGIKLLHSRFFEKQIINERIQSLIFNLGQLRASLVTQDLKKSKKIISKYLFEDDYTSINYIIKENQNFNKEIIKTKELYKEIFKIIKDESNIKYDIKKEKRLSTKYIKTLSTIYEEQRELIKNASFYFLKYSNEIIKKIKK